MPLPNSTFTSPPEACTSLKCTILSYFTNLRIASTLTCLVDSRLRLLECLFFAEEQCDLGDLQPLQLIDHFVDRETVIRVGSDAEIHLRPGAGQKAGRRYRGRDRASECSTCHHWPAPDLGAGLGVTSASTRPIDHLIASTNIFCIFGLSQLAST